jgi:hypothetical protein
MKVLLLLFLSALLLPVQAPAQHSPDVQRTNLTEPTSIDGILCDRTGGLFSSRFASLYASGRLESCSLAEDTRLFGHALPAGTRIHLREDGTPRWAFMARDAALQGLVCRGSGPTGHQTTFHPDGALQTCWMAGDRLIEEIPCRKATFWADVRHGDSSVRLTENGSLESCLLASTVQHDGIILRRGQRFVVEPASSARRN